MSHVRGPTLAERIRQLERELAEARALLGRWMGAVRAENPEVAPDDDTRAFLAGEKP
jgi:hypothetical protein